MIKGIQTGFWQPPERLRDLYGFGWRMLRLDYQPSVEQAAQCIADARAAGFEHILLLVKDPADIPKLRMLVQGPLKISGPNEPDLEVRSGFLGLFRRPSVSIAQYGAWLAAAAPACQAAGYECWAPVISNLNNRGLKYLSDLWPTLAKYPSVGIDVHRYAPGNDAHAPQEGSATRAGEIARLKAIIGTRKWGVSEFGYASPPNTETQQVNLWGDEFAFWEKTDAQYVIAYQVPRSPTDQYGVLDDSRWLPAARIFETVQSPEPIVPSPEPPPVPIDVVGFVSTALSAEIVNFANGGCSRFERRLVNAQGADETATLVVVPDGYAILSPNATQWLSIQPDGVWEGRPASGTPGPWETFTRDGQILTEKPKDGATRPPQQLIIKAPLGPAPSAPEKIERLTLAGNELHQPNGARIFLRGTDAFCAYELWLSGSAGQAQLRDALNSWKARVPFNLLRVWSMSVNLQANEFGRPPFNPKNYPNFYSELKPFHQFCAQYGWLYWGLGPDIGLIDPDRGWQQAHSDQFWAEVHDLDSLFAVEYQNEAAAKWYNQFAAGFVPAATNRPWVGTSYSPSDPAYASGTFPAADLGGGPLGDLHPTRNYNAHILDCCPVNNVYFTNNKGVLLGEPDRYGWQGNPNRRQAELSAAATTAGAVGSVFHSKRGMRCEPFDADTANCAEGWFGSL